MKWRVTLRKIVWDDGKGEYDVSGLPHRAEYLVEAPSHDVAIEWAMDAASEDTGSLIEGCEASATRSRAS